MTDHDQLRQAVQDLLDDVDPRGLSDRGWVLMDVLRAALATQPEPTWLPEDIGAALEWQADQDAQTREAAISNLRGEGSLITDVADLPTPAMRRMDLRVIRLKSEAIEWRKRAERAEAALATRPEPDDDYPLFEGEVDTWTTLDDNKGEVTLVGSPMRPPNPNSWGKVVVYPTVAGSATPQEDT